MPIYIYKCENCNSSIEEYRKVDERDNAIKCSICSSILQRIFNIPMINPVEPTTVGKQAEINAKRMGKELYEKKAEEYSQPHRKATGKLPKGAKPVEAGKKVKPWWRDGSLPGTKKMDKPLDVSKIKDTTNYILKGEKD